MPDGESNVRMLATLDDQGQALSEEDEAVLLQLYREPFPVAPAGSHAGPQRRDAVE